MFSWWRREQLQVQASKAKNWTFSLNLPFVMQEWKGFISCVMASQILILKAITVKMSISSSSYHNHDSSEEGYRQWVEMKTVLLFLCQLEGRNFSHPNVLGPWVRAGKCSHEVKPSESFLLQWGLQHGASRYFHLTNWPWSPTNSIRVAKVRSALDFCSGDFRLFFYTIYVLKVLLSFLLLQLWNSWP